ncbi:MAG: hypothetical protein Q9180_005324, partial [Flavoplaca navasiana]
FHSLSGSYWRKSLAYLINGSADLITAEMQQASTFGVAECQLTCRMFADRWCEVVTASKRGLGRWTKTIMAGGASKFVILDRQGRLPERMQFATKNGLDRHHKPSRNLK